MDQTIKFSRVSQVIPTPRKPDVLRADSTLYEESTHVNLNGLTIYYTQVPLTLHSYQRVEEQYRMGVVGNLLMDSPPHTCLANLSAMEQDRLVWRTMVKQIL